MKINVVRNVLAANDAVAGENRRRMEQANVFAVNITSAPGSGKTSLLEKTIAALLPDFPAGVIVGDLQTTRDAERLAGPAAEVTQINTEGGCHLSAVQVQRALEGLALEGLDFLFIENVGNMVCPSGFDLGEHARVAMLSVPEGDDKVAKYPTLFQPADVIILNKTDLIGVLDYDFSRVTEDLSRINTRAPFLRMSAKTGEGLDEWIGWLRARGATEGGN